MLNAVTGFHAIEESLRVSDARGELFVSGKSTRIEGLIRIAKAAGVPVRRISVRVLDEMVKGREHRGAVYIPADLGKKTQTDIRAAISRIDSPTAFVVVLDQITDPHNLGAILRSADLFSVDLLVLPGRRSAGINPTVVKTSAGASNYVSITTSPNITRAVNELKKAGFWIYGADADGTPAHQTDLTGRVALVMGSEGRGLSRLVRDTCDSIVSIPIHGNIDSLNVSVAAGICMYEVRRQQNFTF